MDGAQKLCYNNVCFAERAWRLIKNHLLPLETKAQRRSFEANSFAEITFTKKLI